MKKILLGLILLTSVWALADECYIALNPSTAVAISKDESSNPQSADSVKVILEKRDYETALHLKIKPKNATKSLNTIAFNFPDDLSNRFGIECDGGEILTSQTVSGGETLLVLNSKRARFSTSSSEGCEGQNVVFKDLTLKRFQCPE